MGLNKYELRLNNLVHGFGGGDGFRWNVVPRYLAKVIDVGEGSMFFEFLEDKPKLYHTHFEPIDLTEDWLIKLGFYKKDLAYFFDYAEGESFYIERLAIFGRATLDHSLNGPITNKIAYVHQLQNLYFALTGEELTIKQ